MVIFILNPLRGSIVTSSYDKVTDTKLALLLLKNKSVRLDKTHEIAFQTLDNKQHVDVIPEMR